MASGDVPSPATRSLPVTIRRTASSQSALQPQQSGPLSLRSAASSATSVSGWQSTQDRLNEILEVGRQRASTMNLQGLSPGRSPIMPSERVPPSSDRVDEPDERTSFVAARNTMNYQSTQTTSSLRSRQPVQPEIDPAGHNGSAAHDADADAEEKKHWLWNSLDGVWSFELENKGSVARDHLAVGTFDRHLPYPYQVLSRALEITGLTWRTYTERTFLAWLRTSLAFASIGIAITQLFRLNASLANEKTNQHFRRLGKPLGTAFIGISILVLLLGYQRFYQPQQWLLKGKFPASRGPIVLISLVSFALMVVSLVVVLVAQPPDMQ
ncbi:hypothetical protein GGR58DRAFT_504233 [Xylaria digitata]|nr:hypothetical protein GGR58DRAFT_504233 [Xylaria digitata]